MQASKVTTLDLTGGAPEMNDHFHRLVIAARKLGVRVIDRCNLTILSEPGYEALAQLLAEQQVEVSASLPCYSQENVDKQRGEGVFDASIAGLKKLNALGYGKPDSGLVLNLDAKSVCWMCWQTPLILTSSDALTVQRRRSTSRRGLTRRRMTSSEIPRSFLIFWRGETSRNSRCGSGPCSVPE